jgi:hypothetical protein
MKNLVVLPGTICVLMGIRRWSDAQSKSESRYPGLQLLPGPHPAAFKPPGHPRAEPIAPTPKTATFIQSIGLGETRNRHVGGRP